MPDQIACGGQNAYTGGYMALSSLVKENILYPLFLLTESRSSLHEALRKFIVRTQIPLIKVLCKFLMPEGYRCIEFRHSLSEVGGFNIFMSDIDLTIIIGEETAVPEALKTFYGLKKIFPNLGEPEIMTVQEVESISEEEQSRFESIWTLIFQLRKISWQQEKMKNPNGAYEVAKVQRGLKKSMAKLKTRQLPVVLDAIFPDCPVAKDFCELEDPHFSHYLEGWVGTEDTTDRILNCRTTEKFQGFIQLIPGHQTVDRSLLTHPLRRYLLRKEINLSLAQLRIRNYQGINGDHIAEWIERLKSELQESLENSR